jgi:hypothetical protein
MRYILLSYRTVDCRFTRYFLQFCECFQKLKNDGFSYFPPFFPYLRHTQLLEECEIPVPPYATVNRDFPYQDVDYLVEEEDYVQIHCTRIMKPFVEKPVDGELQLCMIFLIHHNIFLHLVAFGQAVSEHIYSKPR